MSTPEEWAWFNAKNPVFWVQDTIGIVAYRDGGIAAAALIDNRVNNSAQMHIVIEDPIVIRHGFFEAMFNTAFGETRKFLFGNVSSLNEKIIKLAKHVGFTEIARLEDARDVGDDMVVLRLRREDCKYLGD